ncbi:VOC family protein [Spirulina sp. 06S082]|uniref:VOC family protein n=1 Tax=Spirulina sp. 06S082 TaxID=3110248 RepID=UPI002B21A200|nr:VOC family protein [Spirulina sp. 06S082]MEA5471037.1 VOC family protein [Spirulina sp. 06S082]
MEITQCLHTALLVCDLDRAKHFYGTILNLPIAERDLKFAGVWYQVGNYQIHLIVNTEFSGNLYDRAKWGRNAHIAFNVDNLAELKQRLQAHNWPMQLSSSGRAAIFIQDADKNIIEVNQM